VLLVLKRRHGIAERLRGLSPSDIHVCAITWAEARADALRSQQLTVVSANLDEFRRVPGLAVEDWRKA
jgi:hypothetical protein